MPQCNSEALRVRVRRATKSHEPVSFSEGTSALSVSTDIKSVSGSFPIWPEYNKDLRYCEEIERKWEKCVVVGDLHFPTMNVRAYQKMVIDNSDADALVLLGDGPDTDRLSYWGAERPSLALREELLGFRDVLAWTLGYIKEIYWIEGNHEHRAKMMWDNVVPDDLKMMVKPPSIADFVIDPNEYLEEIAIEYVPLKGVEYLDEFQVIINNVLFVHPSQVRRVPLSVAVERFLAMWGWGYKIDGLLYNHSHWADGVKVVDGKYQQIRDRSFLLNIKEAKSILTQIEKLLVTQRNILIIENGCMCHLQQYSKENRKMIPRPGVVGYSVLYFDKGKLNIERSRFVNLA